MRLYPILLFFLLASTLPADTRSEDLPFPAAQVERRTLPQEQIRQVAMQIAGLAGVASGWRHEP